MKSHSDSISDKRLPCGCLGECNPYAHDTAWDWDGTPSRPDWTDLSSREQELYIREHPYCQDCGDDLTADDIEMTRRFCKECAEKPANRCDECGQFIADDMEICLDCAHANEETERRVDEILYDRSQPL